MKINIICYIFSTIIILFPIINNYIKSIRIKHLLKRIMGCTLYFLEAYLIIYFLKNKLKIGKVDVLSLFYILIVGASTSIIALIIKNYDRRDMLYKLIKDFSVEGISNPMLREITWGFVTCIVEEIVWRGMIQDSICEKQNVIVLITTSIVFMISHIKRKISFSNMIEIFVLSCILGTIWILTENILYCVLFHWIRNSITVIITYMANKP